MIKDVRIYNRPLSKKEFFDAYLTKAESFGKDRDLSRYKRINVMSCAVPILGKVVVETDYKDLMIYKQASGEAGFREGSSLLVELYQAGAQEPVLHQSVSALPDSGLAVVSLDVVKLPVGKYEVRVTFRDSAGRPTQITAADSFDWSGRPSWLSGNPPVKVLNNLVVELLNLKEISPEAGASFTFRNPRESWVFFRTTAEVEKGGSLSLVLGPDDHLSLHGEKGQSTLEAMRLLPAGRYSLGTQSQGATLKSLVVRSIPEIVYSRLLPKPYRPWMSAFGPYDWEFHRRVGVLANANVIMSRDDVPPDSDHASYMEEWASQGKKWVTEEGTKSDYLEPETVLGWWLKLPGMRLPKTWGIFLDEGLPRTEELSRAWIGALHLLAKDERAKGRKLYPYVGAAPDDPGTQDLVRTIMKYGHRLAPNTYVGEEPSLGEAEISLDRWLRQSFMRWRKTFPGVERHIIVNLGYMSAPPESLDRYPSVDYKVFMDMQFNLIANDPAFSGVFGVMEYNSRNVDEEILRWTVKLYRHYAIEGRRERLTSDPYILPHLSNGDFEQGGDGWTLSPAEKGSISFGRKTGHGRLSGRYPPSDLGDTFLCTKRSKKRANTFSQEIVKLTPGRTYSLRFITADRQDMSVEQKHAVAVEIQEAEVLPEKTIHHPWEQVWGGVTPCPWMNFYRIVFRARSKIATLVISDWASPTSPGGPEGQQLMFNFVQVQPYFDGPK